MTTGMRRYVAHSAQLLTRGLPGKQVGEVAAQTIRILEHVVTYLTRWYFLLLHKAHPRDLMTTPYPSTYPRLGLNPDWMGQKISEQGQDCEFLLPLSLSPALCYTSSPLAFTVGTLIFCRFWNYYLVVCSEVYIILNRITLHGHRRLSLRLDAYVWLSYFLTALSHWSASLLETHPLTGLITQSLKWCIPYIYSILLHTHCFCVKNQDFQYHQSFCRDHSAWIFKHCFSWLWFLIHLFNLPTSNMILFKFFPHVWS